MLRKQFCSLPEWDSYNISENNLPNSDNATKILVCFTAHKKLAVHNLWCLKRISRALFIFHFNKQRIGKEQQKEATDVLGYLSITPLRWTCCGWLKFQSCKAKHMWLCGEPQICLIQQEHHSKWDNSVPGSKMICPRQAKNTRSRWRQKVPEQKPQNCRIGLGVPHHWEKLSSTLFAPSCQTFIHIDIPLCLEILPNNQNLLSEAESNVATISLTVIPALSPPSLKGSSCHTRIVLQEQHTCLVLPGGWFSFLFLRHCWCCFKLWDAGTLPSNI